jgi:hypothetical protein
VGVNIHKDIRDEEDPVADIRAVLVEFEAADKGFHPKGSSNNREQHCACKILEIRVEIIEDIDGI